MLDITETTPRQDLSAFLKWAENIIAKEVKQNEQIQQLENKQLMEKTKNANINTITKTSK